MLEALGVSKVKIWFTLIEPWTTSIAGWVRIGVYVCVLCVLPSIDRPHGRPTRPPPTILSTKHQSTHQTLFIDAPPPLKINIYILNRYGQGGQTPGLKIH